MSEFSESYHLLTADQQAGVAMVNRAGLAGFVFSGSNNWVTILVEDCMFEPNTRLTGANEGTLLHYMNPEDHGWGFTLFEKTQPVSRFMANWEEEPMYDTSMLHLPPILDAARTATGRDVSPSAFESMIKPDDLWGMIEAGESLPAYQFAELVGLTHYAWLDYEGFRNNADLDSPEFSDVVAIR